MSEIIFDEFLTYCDQFLQGTDAHDLKKLMIKRYNECNHDYRISSDFSDLVQIARAKIDSDSSRVFVHLRDFLTELKAYKKKKKGHKRPRDSGLSDGDTPSPKSLKGDHSESSSDEKRLVKAKSVQNHSGTDSDSGVGSGLVTNKNNKHNGLPASPLVNGECKEKEKVTVYEIASQSDDDCVVIDDTEIKNLDKDKNSEPKSTVNSVNENSLHSTEKDNDRDIEKSDIIHVKEDPAPSKTEVTDFQDVFKNFTTSTSTVICNSDDSESVSESEVNNENADVSSNISDKEINGTSKSDSELENSNDVKDKSKLDDVVDVPVDDADTRSVESPKPSTSADYRERTPEPSTSTDGDDKNNGSVTKSAEKDKDEGNVEDSPDKTTKVKKASKRQIRRLEQLLEDIRDQIEKLKERELSLDDLDDDESAYVLEDKYQKKFVKVWNKLCELKGRTETTGRPTERKFVYNGTRFPEINRKIERFINKNKAFPDYGDIHNIVSKINLKQGLGMKGTAVDRLSREAFSDVGDQLQKRRKEDLNITFLGHLTKSSTPYQSSEDPALKDPELKKTLEENKKASKSRLEEVINKFVEKQDERDFATKEGDKSGEEHDDNEDDEEEEEEKEEDVEVPEITTIIDDEDDGDDDDFPKIDIQVTPFKREKGNDTVDYEEKGVESLSVKGLESESVINLNSESSSDSEDDEEDESGFMYHRLKKPKVVLSDVLKTSPYKFGLDVLMRDSKDIIIEKEEVGEGTRSVTRKITEEERENRYSMDEIVELIESENDEDVERCFTPEVDESKSKKDEDVEKCFTPEVDEEKSQKDQDVERCFTPDEEEDRSKKDHSVEKCFIPNVDEDRSGKDQDFEKCFTPEMDEDQSKKDQDVERCFTPEVDEERSKSGSPELKSRIDSLVTNLMNDSDSDGDLIGDSSKIESRSSSPELTLKITSVQHIDAEMFSDPEQENVESEQQSDIIFEENVTDKYSQEFKDQNQSSANQDFDSVESISDEDIDKHSCVVEISNSLNNSVHKNSTLDNSSENCFTNSDTEAENKSKFSQTILSPSFSTSTPCNKSSEQNDHGENSEKSNHQQSRIKPEELFNRIVTAKDKLKLNKPISTVNNLCHVTTSTNHNRDSDVIEIEDSDEESSDQEQNQQNDCNNYEENNCCIILSDSD